MKKKTALLTKLSELSAKTTVTRLDTWELYALLKKTLPMRNKTGLSITGRMWDVVLAGGCENNFFESMKAYILKRSS